MIDRQQFLMHAHLETQTLEAWIHEEWLIPRKDAAGENFSEADVARAHLIHGLKGDLGVNDEGIDVILHLIDQLHDLRRTMRDLLQSARKPE